MRLKSFIITVFTLACILTMITSSMVNIQAVTPDDSVDGVQYLSGTWNIINFPESYTDEIIILTGNLTSYNKLNLINTALKMNSTALKKYNINTFTSNANLTLTNNSVITANNPQYKYDIVFNSGSKAYILNSTISYAGYAGGVSEGIFIKSNDVVFKNAVISNNYNGIVCFSTSPKLYNSNIKNSVNKDIVLKGNSHPKIIDTKLDKNKVDVQDTSSLAIKWHFSLKVQNTSNEMLENVKVTIKNSTGATYATFYTDSSGMVSDKILPECIIYPDETINHSPYTIILEKDEFKTEEIENVELNDITSLEATMILRPPDGMIGGKVIDENGNPLENVKITVTKNDKEIATELTNSSGEYYFPEIPEDVDYNISASPTAPGYESGVSSGIDVTGNNLTMVDFNLTIKELPVAVNPQNDETNVDPDSFITVTFEDIMNLTSFEANFELIEKSTNSEVTGTIETLDNKTYIFTPDSTLSYGEVYVIRIFKFVKNAEEKRPLWDTFESEFTTGWGAPVILTYQPTGIDVPLSSQIILSFDQQMNRTTVENAIKISPSGTMSFSWSSYLGIEDAIITISYVLVPGIIYNVSVETSAKSAQNKFLDKKFSWEFTTEAKGIFTGKVLDVDGNPIKGAKVTITSDASPVPLSAVTSDNGSFTINNIPTGNYNINISASGYKTKLESYPIESGMNDRGPVTLTKTEIKKPDVTKDEDEELSSDLVIAYAIIIFLVIIIMILIVLIALKKKYEEGQVMVAPPEEERVSYYDVGREEEGEKEGFDEFGGEVEHIVPGPEYRGRCPVCKHAVYGDYGCFYCATGGSRR